MTVESSKERRVLINEGTLKRNINPPPTTPRPAAPKAQVAPQSPPSKEPGR